MSAMIGNIVLSGAGAGLVLVVLARLLPNEKLERWGFAAGQAVTTLGAGRLGRAFWEKIESFLENSTGVFLAAMKRGLDSDDDKNVPPETVN